ncbi:MAG: stomatin-like protein [Bacteroidales bacterium]|nr:stomatin-like protein [Bacteroidales bacterium]
MELLITLGVVGLVVIYLVITCIKIIPQSETRIIERLGRYDRTLPSGLNILIPFFDRSRPIHTRTMVTTPRGVYAIVGQTEKIDLREQVYDFAKQNVITKDNVVTEINALLYFQIMDPVKAVYEIDNLPNAIEKLTQTTLRNVIGELELDESLTSRDTINAKLRAVLDEATNKWGVKVNRVELQDITPPSTVRDAMEQQMQAERRRRAEILRAEGDKQAAILESEGKKAALVNQAEAAKASDILNAEAEARAVRLHAEADAEAIRVRAEAEAEAIRRVTDALKESGADPAAYLLATKYVETLQTMTSGKDNKTIYIPYEATGVLGGIGSIKEIFNMNKG